MLKHASVFISLTLAGLYIFGLTFQQGFLGEMGLDETQFQLSPDRIFFQGFLAAARMGTKNLVYLFFSAFSIVFIAEFTILASNWINKTSLNDKFSKFMSKDNQPRKEGSFSEFSHKAFAYVCLASILYLLLILSIITSSSSGKEFATTVKSKIDNGDYTKKEIMLYNEEKALEGFTIICSDTQCGYWLSSGSSIVLNNRAIKWIKSK